MDQISLLLRLMQQDLRVHTEVIIPEEQGSFEEAS